MYMHAAVKMHALPANPRPPHGYSAQGAPSPERIGGVLGLDEARRPARAACAYEAPLEKSAWPEMMMPTMTPKRPRADAKISTTRILTNRLLLSASASAHELPTMPTHILQSSMGCQLLRAFVGDSSQSLMK